MTQQISHHISHIPHHKLNHKKSGVCCFIQTTILLSVIFTLIIGLIYYFGTEELHNDIPHALDQIFSTTTEHQQLITKLQKKMYKYTIVWGANQTGIFQFLEHYADQRVRKDNHVIVKIIQNNIYQTALNVIKSTKQFIQQKINMQDQVQGIQWIFLVKNVEIPLQQIQRLKTTRTKDRILIGVISKPSTTIKGFKKIQFPAIQLSALQEVIAAEFEVSAKIAQILTNFYGTIPNILAHLNQISYTNQKHLGQNFKNLQDLGKLQSKTLKILCKKGIAPLQGNKDRLQQIGAISYDNKTYWQTRVNRLNYELSKQIQCVDMIVPQDIRLKIIEQKQRQAKAKIEQQQLKLLQEEEDEDQDQDQGIQPKSKKSKLQKLINQQKQQPAQQTQKQKKSAQKTKTKTKLKSKSKSKKGSSSQL